MGYYSVALDMTGRFTVVIGGGTVAERKVKGLLEAGATVKVAVATFALKAKEPPLFVVSTTLPSDPSAVRPLVRSQARNVKVGDGAVLLL